MSELYNIGLPKWPAMVVVGEPVTKDQAAEILVRTFNWNNTSNDRDFTRECLTAAGIRIAAHGYPEWESVEEVSLKFGLLNLSYLLNSRIYSAWICGPHGWCDWDGSIFTNNYNIGKWPSVEDVHGEWQTIAEAFPYLNLRCQLYSGETCEVGIPLIEYVVSKGKASVKLPEDMYEKPKEPNITRSLFGGRDERGCTIETLRRALSIAKKSVGYKKARKA